jgi:uncharacterized protein YndB with AHSA1/START domain
MSQPVARVAIPIRRPRPEVFASFVDPSTITKFWLQSTSGPLSQGATVEWHFLVPGAVETVSVHEFEINRKIAFSWSEGVGVTLNFTEVGQATTLVSVEVSGLPHDDLEALVGATEGFSIVLCELKVLLESGHSANLVRDKANLIAGSIP